jgi:hypothetical protein
MAEVSLKSELTDIDAKIEKLKERRKTLLKRAGERVARLATEAGLLDFDSSDDELRDGLAELAARRRGSSKSAAPQAGPTREARPEDPAAH